MYFRQLFLINVLLFAIFLVNSSCLARPNREKRYSDQRLAELETLYKLQQLRGKFQRGPLDYSKIDPNILGRRRRSSEVLLDQLRAELDEDRDRNIAPPLDEDFWNSLLI
ncbi:hypothetical protein LSTR_LSTR010387 [Laodelphax striatellus]|uniref:Corticotropin-releasing factor domain-containing protein n=1 Tax=Laodelphax striatellus TaxID=195883 RepID=A0A482XHE7_LAOST|nr:hypothetical protein LSTR_LSTR010387 [Laodelphax striatellus]